MPFEKQKASEILSEILISTMSNVLRSICGSIITINKQNMSEKLFGLPLYIIKNKPYLISDVLISDLITLSILISITSNRNSLNYDYTNDTITFDNLSVLPNNFENITLLFNLQI